MNRITPPGVVVARLAWLTISSWATATVTEHRGSLLPDGQLLPGVVEVTVFARIMLPVSGLSTVTE